MAHLMRGFGSNLYIKKIPYFFINLFSAPWYWADYLSTLYMILMSKKASVKMWQGFLFKWDSNDYTVKMHLFSENLRFSFLKSNIK